MLSLCVVNSAGKLYAYIPWLERQLADVWKDGTAVSRVIEAQIALMKKYGAKTPTRGRQYDVPLRSLSGKEEQFLSDLGEFVGVIEKTAPSSS